MSAKRIIDDHLELANIGTKTHAQIDTHIADPSAHHVKYTDEEAKDAVRDDIDVILDAIGGTYAFQILSLSTYDSFESYTSGSGGISQKLGIAYVKTGATANSCSRQNLNSQEPYAYKSYISLKLNLGFISGNALGFIGIIKGVKLTETQNTSNLTTKHTGIFFEDGIWYASTADGVSQTKVEIGLGALGTLLIDVRALDHAKFYWNNVLKADITTNLHNSYGFIQCFVHNKALTIDKKILFYNILYRR